MRRVEFRKNVIALFIFSIIVCSVCLEHVPARTTVYQGAVNTISSDVRMEESKMSHAICGERFSQRAEARCLVRSAGRRVGGVTKFSILGMLFRNSFHRLSHFLLLCGTTGWTTLSVSISGCYDAFTGRTVKKIPS